MFLTGEIKEEKGRSPETKDNGKLQKFARAAVICNEGTLYQEEGKWGPPRGCYRCGFPLPCVQDRHKSKGSKKEVEIVAEVPFESERMYAAVYYKEDKSDHIRVAVKGAWKLFFLTAGNMYTAERGKSL
jgi:magnesium-transporting ATPase (P-type)